MTPEKKIFEYFAIYNISVAMKIKPINRIVVNHMLSEGQSKGIDLLRICHYTVELRWLEH